MGEADLLRRAISKKNRDVLNTERAKLFSGAVANGVPGHNALAVYELIVKFADYGFPKSHRGRLFADFLSACVFESS